MALTRRMPFYDLRDWLLSNDRIATLLGHDEGFPPFYPVAQQPESGFPYVRYEVTTTSGFPQWWMRTDFVTLDIHMMDIEDSTELVNEIADMTQEGAWSANQLSIWLENQFEMVEGSPVYRPVDFAYHSVEFAGGAEISAPDEEGAHHSRLIGVALEYSLLTGRSIR